MMRPANTAVRENRRRCTPLDLEQMNVIKALTAAEYSRRQFILNFAASKDTRLLIPGQKSDAVKAAEEWVAASLNQSGRNNVSSEFFKYAVDSRLWATHVGCHVDFPFTFMRGTAEGSMSEPSTGNDEVNRPKGELLLANQSTQKRNADLAAAATPTEELELQPPQIRGPDVQRTPAWQTPPSTPRIPKRRWTNTSESPVTFSAKKRGLSLTNVEELEPPKLAQRKFPFFVRLGRFLSRRKSSA